MTADSDPATTLSEIKARGYRNGATGAECARLSDAAAVDIPLLLAAVEKVLEAADGWKYIHSARCAREVRETITTALTGKEAGDE